MAGPQVAYYGIRHHGPGSSRHLLNALHQFKPDILLVEIPEEAAGALRFFGHRELQPPVAILLYDPDDRESAGFFPFAEFSPEWQAFKYAHENKVPLLPMDLPYAWSRGLSTSVPGDGDIDRYDPLGSLARFSGVADGEGWWDQYVERGALGAPVFDELASIMASLRSDAGQESEQTLFREAWMRRQIRHAVSKSKKRIAVVAGAWHIPVLGSWQETEGGDDRMLGPDRENNWRSTWIPWSYRKLSKASGYGAGVRAPAWYELLFAEGDPVDRWMIRTARLLRSHGRMSSTAEVLEARKLAGALAQLQDQAIPGLPELLDAVRSVMTDGDETWMELIFEELVIGQRFGRVPLDLPENPVRRDFEKELKACRLYAAWESRKKLEKVLDLRKPTAAMTSTLLHRLTILDIPWGRELPWEAGSTGSFREYWVLNWDEDFERRLVQAGMYGNTIEEACVNYLLERSGRNPSLSEMAGFLERSVKAALTGLPERFFIQYQRALAGEDQVLELITAYSRLASAERYGSVRDVDRAEISRLLEATFPRIWAGLADGLSYVDEESAAQSWAAVREFLTLAGLREQDGLEDLVASLLPIPDDPRTDPFLSGAVTALLFNRSLLELDATLRFMSLRLTDREDPEGAARFVEGFLSGAGGSIWQDDRWLEGLDRFISAMDSDVFERTLPVLRRAFSEYGTAERRRILQFFSRGKKDSSDRVAVPAFDMERMRALVERWERV